MSLYVPLTNCEYDLNQRESRLLLREHLKGLGFFNPPENKPFYELMEKEQGETKDVKALFDAIGLYEAVLRGRAKKGD